MQISARERRMHDLAISLPSNYEKKEAGDPGVNDLKSLRDEIINTVKEYKTYAKDYVETSLKGYVDPETKSALEKIAIRMNDLEAQLRKPFGGGDGMPLMAKTIGNLFVESEELKQFKNRGWHKGGVAVRFKSWFEESINPQLKTTITTGTVGTAMDQNLRVPGIIQPYVRELRIRDLLRVTPTTATAIEYVKENVFTNAASPQVEGSAKPEAALTFTLASAPVRTIAHWIPATRQVLDDMDQLMSYIDTRLRFGLKIVEEAQLLSGDGTGQNLSGLITQATAYETSRNVAGDTVIDKISHAITQAREAEYPVDGVVLHPKDWEKMRLIKTEEGGANKGQYVFGDPGTAQVPRIWNKPIVETTAITAGTFLVGAFALGAELFDRQEATVDVSTEHASFFVENKVAIRAEERLALAVYRPASFVAGSF